MSLKRFIPFIGSWKMFFLNEFTVLFQDIPEMPERRMTDSIGEVSVKFEVTFIGSQQK